MAGQRRPPIRIGIVDDHPIFRLGLKRALEREPDLEIAWELGSAGNLDSTMHKTPVDLLLIDVYLGPSKDGIVATRQMVERWPDLKIIAISASLDSQVDVESTRAGADAFLRKAMPVSDMVNAIRKIAAPARRQAGRSASARVTIRKSVGHGKLDALSPRQRQVLEHMKGGRTNREIATRLGVSVATVNKHVHEVLSVLGVRNRTQAVAESTGNSGD